MYAFRRRGFRAVETREAANRTWDMDSGERAGATVAIVAIVVIFGFPILGWIVMRVFRHQERMEMIRHGLVPPPEMPFGIGRGRAWREWARAQRQPPGPSAAGAVWTVPQGADDDPQSALHRGIKLAAVGLALLIGLSFIGGTPGSAGFRGGPWLLGGLIPLFVGLAQIAIAMLSGAELPGAASGRVSGYPPPPPGPNPGPGPVPPPGAWQQPGRRVEELGKPPAPPDLR